MLLLRFSLFTTLGILSTRQVYSEKAQNGDRRILDLGVKHTIQYTGDVLRIVYLKPT